jgi:exosortase
MVLSAFVLAYLPVWKSLFAAWSRSDDYSYGFFIVPIAVYALWLKRERLAATQKSTSVPGLFLLCFSLAVYVLSFYAEINTIASLSLVGTVAGCVLFLYGSLFLKEAAFSVLFLLLMIPIPAQIYSAITVPLQLLVSKASVGILALAGIPIFRDGNVIHLPAHTFEVVQACSGLRSLVTLLTLATAIAYFTLRSNLLRGVLIACALPTAIFVNIIRVMVMITVYHFWGYDLTKGTVHTSAGVVIFLLALAIIYCIRGILVRWDR